MYQQSPQTTVEANWTRISLNITPHHMVNSYPNGHLMLCLHKCNLLQNLPSHQQKNTHGIVEWACQSVSTTTVLHFTCCPQVNIAKSPITVIRIRNDGKSQTPCSPYSNGVPCRLDEMPGYPAIYVYLSCWQRYLNAPTAAFMKNL